MVNNTLLLKPEKGFSHFMKKLHLDAESAGVQFLTAEVMAVKNSCVVCRVESSEIEIYSDTIVHGDGFVTDEENVRDEESHHLVISLGNCFDYTSIPEYIHLPHDKVIHRITHESKVTDQRFLMLVQVRNAAYTENEIIMAIKDILTRFIGENQDLNFKIEWRVSRKYYSLITKRTDQSKSIIHLRTNGNLSRNIVYDLDFYRNLLDDK